MESQHVLAAFGLVACVAALLYGFLPPRLQFRVRAAWSAAGERAATLARRLSRRRAPPAAVRPSTRDTAATQRRAPVDPAREAEALIDRARRARPGVTRDGKVIRPDAFQRPRRPDEPLH